MYAKAKDQYIYAVELLVLYNMYPDIINIKQIVATVFPRLSDTLGRGVGSCS